MSLLQNNNPEFMLVRGIPSPLVTNGSAPGMFFSIHGYKVFLLTVSSRGNCYNPLVSRLANYQERPL